LFIHVYSPDPESTIFEVLSLPIHRKNHEESVSELEIFWQEPMIYIYIGFIVAGVDRL